MTPVVCNGGPPRSAFFHCHGVENRQCRRLRNRCPRYRLSGVRGSGAAAPGGGPRHTCRRNRRRPVRGREGPGVQGRPGATAKEVSELGQPLDEVAAGDGADPDVIRRQKGDARRNYVEGINFPAILSKIRYVHVSVTSFREINQFLTFLCHDSNKNGAPYA